MNGVLLLYGTGFEKELNIKKFLVEPWPSGSCLKLAVPTPQGGKRKGFSGSKNILGWSGEAESQKNGV